MHLGTHNGVSFHIGFSGLGELVIQVRDAAPEGGDDDAGRVFAQLVMAGAQWPWLISGVPSSRLDPADVPALVEPAGDGKGRNP